MASRGSDLNPMHGRIGRAWAASGSSGAPCADSKGLLFVLLGAHCAARARLNQRFTGAPPGDQIAHSEVVVRELKLRSDTSSVISRAHGALCAHKSRGIASTNRSSSRIGPGSYFRFHTSSIPPTPYFLFSKSLPMFGLVAAWTNLRNLCTVLGCDQDPSPRAQPLGSRRRHARRPCGTGSRWPCFIRRGQSATAVVPLCVAPCARRGATSNGPAGHLGTWSFGNSFGVPHPGIRY